MSENKNSIVHDAASLITSQDHFGPLVSDNIRFKGKSQHQTFFGGFMTIGITLSIGIYSYWRSNLLVSHSRDDLMSSEFFRVLPDEEPLYLKGNDVKIWSSFTTPDFDNDDSQYAEIRIHMYDNTDN
jgi:hypothetical protein